MDIQRVICFCNAHESDRRVAAICFYLFSWIVALCAARMSVMLLLIHA